MTNEIKLMKLKKIKAVRPYFYDGAGPGETVDLGIEIDGDAVIFGTFYFGPGSNENHAKLFEKLDKFIDEAVYKMQVKSHY